MPSPLTALGATWQVLPRVRAHIQPAVRVRLSILPLATWQCPLHASLGQDTCPSSAACTSEARRGAMEAARGRGTQQTATWTWYRAKGDRIDRALCLPITPWYRSRHRESPYPMGSAAPADRRWSEVDARAVAETRRAAGMSCAARGNDLSSAVLTVHRSRRRVHGTPTPMGQLRR